MYVFIRKHHCLMYNIESLISIFQVWCVILTRVWWFCFFFKLFYHWWRDIQRWLLNFSGIVHLRQITLKAVNTRLCSTESSLSQLVCVCEMEELTTIVQVLEHLKNSHLLCWFSMRLTETVARKLFSTPLLTCLNDIRKDMYPHI